jgi:beta-galactosidase
MNDFLYFFFFFLQGVAFVNGINVGRYWPAAGPQITLYVPATYFIPSPGINTVVMLELEGVPQDLSIALIDKPKLNGSIDSLI